MKRETNERIADTGPRLAMVILGGAILLGPASGILLGTVITDYQQRNEKPMKASDVLKRLGKQLTELEDLSRVQGYWSPEPGDSIVGLMSEARSWKQEDEERRAYVITIAQPVVADRLDQETGEYVPLEFPEESRIQVDEKAALRRLRHVPEGTLVSITYKGEVKGKKGRRRHDFDVQWVEPE